MAEGLNAADLRNVFCPACKSSLGATGHQATQIERAMIGERMPGKGDLTVCLNCQAWLVFNGEGGVRLMTLPEMNSMPQQDKMMLNQLATFLAGFR